MKTASFIIYLALFFIKKVEPFKTGAPKSACSSMNPSGTKMTSVLPQTSGSPYFLNVSMTNVTAGETILGWLFSI